MAETLIDARHLTEDVFHATTPIVVTGGAELWPALFRWSPALLSKVNSHKTTNLVVSHSGSCKRKADGAFEDPVNNQVLREVEFHAAADMIITSDSDSPKYYISQHPILDHLPELARDVPNWRKSDLGGPNLWFGSAGVATPLHYDLGINLFVQIYGIKDFTLFHPDDTENLYPFPADSKMPHCSAVDVERPDLAQYPKYKASSAQRISIAAGEILMLPPFWWHFVKSRTMSVSINQWYLPSLEQCLGPTGLRWLKFQSKVDRWRRFRKEAQIQKADLLEFCTRHSATAPEFALMAVASVIEEESTSARSQIDPVLLRNLRVSMDTHLQALFAGGTFSSDEACSIIVESLQLLQS